MHLDLNNSPRSPEECQKLLWSSAITAQNEFESNTGSRGPHTYQQVTWLHVTAPPCHLALKQASLILSLLLQTTEVWLPEEVTLGYGGQGTMVSSFSCVSLTPSQVMEPTPSHRNDGAPPASPHKGHPCTPILRAWSGVHSLCSL